jgi:hypothetical protein
MKETLGSFLLKPLYRTVLQTEPVLGGKRLDLLKIYKTVIEAGGYEKVQLFQYLYKKID